MSDPSSRGPNDPLPPPSSSPSPPSPPPATTTPAGWFPDPLGRHEYRWYNGTTWTADVSNGGRRQVDPFGAQHAPSAQSGSGNGIAVAAMVCGILALLTAWIPFVVVAGLTLSILAVVFGVKGRRRAAEVGSGGGPALAGLVTGLVGLALSVIGVVLSVLLIIEVIDFIEPGPVTAEVLSCELTEESVVIDARLRNDSDETRDYTVFGLLRSPRGDGDAWTQLHDVEPDEVVEFQMRRPWFGDTGDCDARLVVQGPFPFGIQVDRTNDAID